MSIVRSVQKLIRFNFILARSPGNILHKNTRLYSFRKYSTVTMPAANFRSHNQIKGVVDDIIKSAEDKRQYRGLELNNGMKVLLISDSTTDKSAAAMDVHIGSMSDPKVLPGLAHFLEHMLFLGTEKYPSENEYSKFLSMHGGSSNAYTADDHTNYFFDVVPDHLKGALDRFAQFFLAPLFTESATDREVKAVNSEHEKNIQSDIWRINQLEKSLSDPTHDFNKFPTGNIKTLDKIPKQQGINVREELLEFHRKWYSSNIMGLAVLGRESLDQLTDMVLENFPSVENKNVQLPEWNDHPFRKEDLKIQSNVVPVKDIRNLTITFPTPDLHPHYKTNPGHYLGHLIGHEGPGSLLSELKSRGWVDSLSGGQLPGPKGFGFFILKCDLTEEGIDYVDDIVTIMFQYLNLLRKEGTKEWIFNECRDLAGMMFRFKDKEDPFMYATSLASALHDYSLKEVLCGPYLLQDYKPELIDMLLSKLTPDNFRMSVIGQKFEPVVDRSEEWYGTKYKVEPVKHEFIDSCKKESFNENLRLPEKNDFIPTKFDLVEREKTINEFPTLIKNTYMSKVWFKQDSEYLLPKTVLKVHFANPLAFSEPLSCGLMNLFVRLFQDSLNEYAYAAQLAGLSYSLMNLKTGMLLNIKGYSHKVNVLLEKIMDSMTSFVIDQKRFDIFKEKYVRGLHNFKAEQPYQQSLFYSDILLSQHGWSKDDLLQIADEITYRKLNDFIPELLAKMSIESLCHGNLTEQQSQDMISMIENKLQERLKTKHLHPSLMTTERAVQLPLDCSFVYKEENTVHSSSCIHSYYQFGEQNCNKNIVSDLYGEIVSEPCFNILRTQEQLGYIVYSGIRHANGVLGMNVLVQSEFPPSYVDGRIEAFLNSMEEHIKEMSEEDFEQHKASLTEKRLEKPKKLAQQSNKYWTEIISHQYNFGRDKTEVSELKNVSKEDVLQFHKNLVSHKSNDRRKLSVHIISASSSRNKSDEFPKRDGLLLVPELSKKPIEVEDIPTFKSGLALFPVAKPAIQIPKPACGAPTKSKL